MNDQFSGAKGGKSSVNRMNQNKSSLDSNFDTNNGLNADVQFADNLGQNQSRSTVQLQASANNSKSVPSPSKAENKTGLPDDLKSGVEELSGYSMDDVKVHYNSSKPAQMRAHAYAQGANIHVGPALNWYNHLYKSKAQLKFFWNGLRRRIPSSLVFKVMH